jgi:hypothetical protein
MNRPLLAARVGIVFGGTIVSLGALEMSLSNETNRQLDEIWPGPGGEAPQAYAW